MLGGATADVISSTSITEVKECYAAALLGIVTLWVGIVRFSRLPPCPRCDKSFFRRKLGGHLTVTYTLATHCGNCGLAYGTRNDDSGAERR